MSKITSKIDVTRAMRPVEAILPDRKTRLRLFDQATKRHGQGASKKPPRDKGWRREDLYVRGRSY